MGTYQKIIDALLNCFTSMCGNSIPVSGPILLEKALKFPKAFTYGDFKACNGWLDGWLERKVNSALLFSLSFSLYKVQTNCRLSLFTEDSSFDPSILKLSRMNNQRRRDKMRQSSINSF